MEISTRRIVLCNVTEHPTLDWVKNQIRDIAAFDRKPRFLLHDNDGRTSKRVGPFGRRKDGFRCHLDRWLSDVMDSKGVPTPYFAPNANPYVERFHRTLREDALNHFLFLNARSHLIQPGARVRPETRWPKATEGHRSQPVSPVVKARNRRHSWATARFRNADIGPKAGAWRPKGL